MKRSASFRLSDAALGQLDDLKSLTGLSGGKVLEGLLLGRYGIRERLFLVGAQWSAEEVSPSELTDEDTIRLSKPRATPKTVDRQEAEWPALPINKLPEFRS